MCYEGAEQYLQVEKHPHEGAILLLVHKCSPTGMGLGQARAQLSLCARDCSMVARLYILSSLVKFTLRL